MAESSIEIPSAPAWLSKLETRREILSKAKIGHETGAGASCNVCGMWKINHLLNCSIYNQ